MPKFFVSTNQIDKNEIIIQNEDVNHIKNVLRAKIKDKIDICDYITSKNYLCEVNQIEDSKILCKIIEEKKSSVESNIYLSIFQGLPKSDKMELVIQKAVELGTYDVTPLKMKRCVVKLKEKDEKKKIERWQKISEVAAKQSGRDIIPQINKVKDVEEICSEFNKFDLVLVAYENEQENTLKKELKKIKDEFSSIKIAIIIGPEGGIDEQEIEKFKTAGAKIITLGKRILRTETVALNVASIIMYELEQK